MDRLLLDLVQLGKVPIYPLPSGTRYYQLEENVGWEPRRATGNNKILVCIGVDYPLPKFHESLTAGKEVLSDPGTLIFALRGVEAWATGLSEKAMLFVLGSMAFVPHDTSLGEPFQGDPWPVLRQLILETFRLHNGGARMGDLHPMVVDSVRRYQSNADETDFRKEMRDVEERALRILRANLDEIQREELERHSYFHTVGQDGHTYRIAKNHSHGVHRLINGVPAFEYCLVADMHIPTYDLMLMQKLLIEADTPRFLETANAWDIRGGKRTFFRDGQLTIVDSRGVAMRHGEEEAPGAPG
jgi:hypothetical protein